MPEWNLIAAAVFGLFVLYILSRILYHPLKILLRVSLQMAAGGAVIALYNMLMASWGMAVGINLISSLVVGLMGLPGLAMLVALRYILLPAG